MRILLRRMAPGLVGASATQLNQVVDVVIATRDRFSRLRSEMKPGDWDAVYGNSVRIINDNIVAAFRPEQIERATQRAKELESSVFIVAKGVLG